MNPQPQQKGEQGVKRILVVDDHPLTRHGVSQWLSREPSLVVCGEAGGAREALAAVASLHPDLVLADITMPHRSGLEFLKDMQVMHPDVPVLVLSLHDENLYAERALRAGARGYLMKSEGGEKLLEAIHEVLLGGIHLSKELSHNVFKRLFGGNSPPNKGVLSGLTDREFEVFQLMGQGLSTREIGCRLSISGKTVETHRIHLKENLKLETGTDLTSYAVHWAASNQLI